MRDSQVTIQLHVAPEGSDDWSGLTAKPDTRRTDGPLRSIAGARARVLGMRADGQLAGSVEVLIHAGTYEMKETIRFGPEDLDEGGASIAFRSAGDGEVRLLGGAKIRGFERSRRGHGILQLDLAKAGLDAARIKGLLFEGAAQQAARYPGYDPVNPYGGGWLYVEGADVDMYEDGHGRKDRFFCRDPRLASWGRIDEIELVVFPRFNYTNSIVRLRSYDPDTGEVVLAEPAIYDIYPGDRFYFRNVREELRDPGEWYCDAGEGMLYYIPPAAADPEDIEVVLPLVEHMFEWTGDDPRVEDLYAEKIDWEESGCYIRQAERPPAPSRKGGITLRGVTMEGCHGAAVVMRHVSDSAVIGCTVRETGGPGIVVLGGTRCRVAGNDIHHTGSHGVYASGGMRSPFAGRYAACGHEVVNNYIHHIGRVNKSVAGVALNGVGVRAAHNLIHDGPRWGILSRGNDHLIEYNHIRHVNIETSDTSAIYLVDRDLTMHGTIIRYNRIHDILGYHKEDGVWQSPAFAFGIYLDDFTSGVEVTGNLVYRTPGGGLYIHAGQDNRIENNMFLLAGREAAKFRRWREEVEYRVLGTHGIGFRRNQVRRNIFTARGSKSYLFRFDTMNDAEDRLDAAGNVWEDNLVWQYGKPVAIRVTSYVSETILQYEEWLNLGLDARSVAAEPRFEAEESDRFALRADSPALALGFEQLPFERMGLQRSDERASWPVVEAEGVREYPLNREREA